MTDSTPPRKSGRQRIPNKKYSNDGLKVLNAVLSSDSEDAEIIQRQLLQDDSDDFPVDQVADEQEEDDEVSHVGDVSEGSEIPTPVEEKEDAHSNPSPDRGSPPIPKTGRRKAKGRVSLDTNSRSRGMPENPLRKDLARNLASVFTGEGVEDISHFVKSRNQWAADPILPRRSQLRHGFSHTEDKRQMEATVGWEWYYDHGGCDLFEKKQSVQGLTPNQAVNYLGFTASDRDFVMGPYGRQTKFNLAPSHTLTLDQAWKFPKSLGEVPKRRSHGWMLNVGARVKCLDWAPNHDRSMQYLALATASVAGSKQPSKEPPAFTPLAGPSAIQIWAIPTSPDGVSDAKPFVRVVLCTDWGDIKQMKWCPVPRVTRDPVTRGESTLSSTFVGLLAAVFSDGFVRVLDVQLEHDEGSSTSLRARRYNSAAFEARPLAGNLSTCLTWLSGTDLAIGDSSGHLAIYDICPVRNSNSSDALHNDLRQENGVNHRTYPTPWLSIALHSTYILALASAYPTHPSLLMSSSLSGYLRLTSLRAPTTDYVLSVRTYTPPSTLAYCDSIFSAVWAEESSETVRLSGLRCFYASVACESLPGPPGPGPGIVDAGKCHSSVAAGGADGSVFITNPQRKVLGNKKAIVYQQCIFKHEWRPTEQTGEDEGRQRQGISRITEGYLPDRVWLGPKDKLGKSKETVPTTTIYENETAVTALAWNPNVNFGGWLAVGWGSGLVRVQDVAVD